MACDSFWSVKYLKFGQKLLIRTVHHTFLERRHPEVPKNGLNQLMDYLGVYILFDSESYLGRSKEYNNQGIKCRSREHLKAPFCYKKNKNKNLNPSPFSSNSHFKINVPLFCCLLFFNPKVRINKIANKDCNLLSQCFRITLKDASKAALHETKYEN